MMNGIYFTGDWNDGTGRFFVGYCPDFSLNHEVNRDFPSLEDRQYHYQIADNLQWEYWEHNHLIDKHPFKPGFEACPQLIPVLSGQCKMVWEEKEYNSSPLGIMLLEPKASQ